METGIRQITIVLWAACLLGGCGYDLDVTGFVATPVPVGERFLESREWTGVNGEFEIVSDSSGYSFFVGGDSHVGTVANLETMLLKAEAEGALAVAVAGDLTTGRREDMVRTDSLFDEYPGIGKYNVPGNHDLYFRGWETYFEFFGPSAYTLRIRAGDATDMLIFLDTGSGTLGVEQIAWLENVLEEERPSCRHAVVITHLNFFRNKIAGSTNPLNEEVLMLIDLFTRHDVDMVIQGHDHRRFEKILGETTYLTLNALKDGDKNASFVELQVSEGGIGMVFHHL